jgi:hypothetical protein
VTNGIGQALDQVVLRLSRSLGQDAGRAVAKLYRTTGGNLNKNVERTLKADASKAADMTKIIGQMDRNAAKTAVTDAQKKAQAHTQAQLRLRMKKLLAPDRPNTGNPVLDKLNRPRRPTLRKPTQTSIFKEAERAPNGEDFVCPNSGEIIPCQRNPDGTAKLFDDRGRPTTDGTGHTRPAPNPPSTSGQPQVYNFGHVQDSEFHRLKQVVADNPGQHSWQEILDEYNKPEHYQIEHPPTNQSHEGESTDPGYGHYAHLDHGGAAGTTGGP